MRFQFGTEAMLLVPSAVAIACAGLIAWTRIGVDDPLSLRLAFSVIGTASPLWMPFAFIAFAAGRMAITAKMVLGFALAEAAAVVVAILIMRYA